MTKYDRGGADEGRTPVTTLALRGRRFHAWAMTSRPMARAQPYDHRAQIDAQHVELSRADPEKFGAIFDEYFAAIHGYVARRLGADVADDVAAETFETAFRKRRQYDASRGTVRAWLFGIATRHLSRHQRAEVRALRALTRTAPSLIVDGDEDAIADRVSAQAWTHQLARALGSLAQGDRDVLLLIALGDLRHDEVSSALGIPYGTVGSRLSRARRKLRAELAAWPSGITTPDGTPGTEVAGAG